MKNNFKINNYTGLHEFGCLHCEHIIKPDHWPDSEKKISCRKHGIQLSFLLNDDGYCIHDEWFCRDILNKRFPDFHVQEFNAIKNKLKPDCMYQLTKETIKEVSFDALVHISHKQF